MGRPTPDTFMPPALPPSYEPAAASPWLPPPPPPPSSDLVEGLVTFLVVFFMVFAPLLILACCANEDPRENRDRADAAAAAPPPWALPPLRPSRHYEELHPRQARAANSAARRLPAFKYSQSHKSTGGGDEEAAACPVCLGAFQLGETVRLLPVCLHLYHVECIDPWLDAHSTCPICRSDTVPTIDVARLPPVPFPVPAIHAAQRRLIFSGR